MKPSMKVIIIEDETPAAARLNRMLQDLGKGIEVTATLDSVESSVNFLRGAEPGSVELLFMDIQLADGISFSIFQQVPVTQPVIFTTAFDHYVLKAFKVNSIDYLLKPIDGGELMTAVEKFQKLYVKNDDLAGKIEQLFKEMNSTKYRERLLIKRGQQLNYLKTPAVAHCHADGKLCYATDFNGNSHLLDNNLQQLEASVNPRMFYRVNRQLLVNIEAIRKVHTWLGGRLKLDLSPPTPADTIVSRERVNGFKDWLGQ
jgi:DNA-binding LytR/AlgR family response regulator